MSAPSLWRLYSGGKTAYVIGDFGDQLDPGHEAFERACAAWPGWTGQGSGTCEAGPGSWKRSERDTTVLVPDLQRLRAEVERLTGWLRQIEGGDHPCTDQEQLRQWAYQALTLGQEAP